MGTPPKYAAAEQAVSELLATLEDVFHWENGDPLTDVSLDGRFDLRNLINAAVDAEQPARKTKLDWRQERSGATWGYAGQIAIGVVTHIAIPAADRGKWAWEMALVARNLHFPTFGKCATRMAAIEEANKAWQSWLELAGLAAPAEEREG